MGGHDACSRVRRYSEQKKCYIAKMVKLSEKLNIVWEDMVDVVTVDRMQGHESNIIILDWVFDSGTKSDLGFASDNRWANITLTRARTYLVVVANGRIFNNDRLSEAKRSLRRYTRRFLSISSISWIITLLLIIQQSCAQQKNNNQEETQSPLADSIRQREILRLAITRIERRGRSRGNGYPSQSITVDDVSAHDR
ncbi:hypothetical protein RU639_011583 [Aspergillus parasiticus]